MEDRLYLRGRIWWGWIYDLAGKRADFSTQQRDKKAARAVLRDEERRATDPNYARSHTTLSDALALLIKDRKEGVRAVPPTCAQATVEMYESKAGVLTRVLETNEAGQFAPLPLVRLTAGVVDDYISARRGEWALPPRALVLDAEGKVKTEAREGRHISDSTIHKELVTLSGALKIALRRGLWSGNLEAIMPSSFSPEYKPRTRRLSVDELESLLGALPPDRAARVAFIVATSAEWIATERALDEDISMRFVLVRGSKNSNRYRTVPIVSVDQHRLLEHAMKCSRGADGKLFRPWSNVRRDLIEACKEASIPPCSPNDLRRTCATWLRAAGVTPANIAPLMGHSDSKMVEKVYGRLSPRELGVLLAAQMPGSTAAHLQLTDADSPGFGGQTGKVADLENSATPSKLLGFKVPGTGIEPVTRGFSVPCSTN
jgi:integrase